MLKTPRYAVGSQNLERVTIFKDLGVHLDPTLSFRHHYTVTTAKAYAMLGFIKRICWNMTNPHALKSLPPQKTLTA